MNNYVDYDVDTLKKWDTSQNAHGTIFALHSICKLIFNRNKIIKFGHTYLFKCLCSRFHEYVAW